MDLKDFFDYSDLINKKKKSINEQNSLCEKTSIDKILNEINQDKSDTTDNELKLSYIDSDNNDCNNKTNNENNNDFEQKNDVYSNYIINENKDEDNINNNKNIVNDNNVLLISEKLNKVVLPYTKDELEEYIKQYPDNYESYNDVINKEFIYPLSYYVRNTDIARFREGYSLIRDREKKTVFESLKYAFQIMFKSKINPAIIAACKTQKQLEKYINELENDSVQNFKDFNILYEMNPI